MWSHSTRSLHPCQTTARLLGMQRLQFGSLNAIHVAFARQYGATGPECEPCFALNGDRGIHQIQANGKEIAQLVGSSLS